MPQQRVQFNGVTHEFPADFTEADIAAALGTAAAPTTAAIPRPTTPAAPRGTLATIGDYVRERASAATGGLSDAVIGGVKGALTTATGLGELVHKIPGVSAATDAIYGMPAGSSRAAFGEVRRDLQGTNTAERIGFGAEQIGEFLIPFGGQAKALGMAAKAAPAVRAAAAKVGLATPLAKVPQGLVTGAARAGGEVAEQVTKAAAQSGGDEGDIVTAALMGGMTPAAAATVRGVGRLTTHAMPEALYQRVFKLAEDDWLKSVQSQAKGQPPNPTLAREVLDRGLRGSPRAMALFTVKKGAEIEKALQQAVKGQTTVLPQRPEYAKLLEGIAREFGGSFSLMGRDARNLAGKLRASAPLQTTDALALKRLLDRSRTSGSFKMNQKLSAKQDEYKQAADQLRGVLHQDQAIAGLLTEERIMIEALDNLVDFGVKSGNRKFTDMVDRLILTGGALMPAMAPGAVATVGAVKGAQSAFMLTNLGQGLHMLRGVVEPAAKAATGTMRAGTATLTGGQ